MSREVLANFNSSELRHNFPVYTPFSSVWPRRSLKNRILRIPGHRPERDIRDVGLNIPIPPRGSGEDADFTRFDYQDMIICNKDGEILEQVDRETTEEDLNQRPSPDRTLIFNHQDLVTLRVYAEAREFAVLFPANFLLATRPMTFNDLQMDGLKPDAYAYQTRRFIQILFHLLSKNHIELCWEGDLAGETVPNPEYEEFLAGRSRKRRVPETIVLKEPKAKIACSWRTSFKLDQINGSPDSHQFSIMSVEPHEGSIRSVERTFNRFTIDLMVVTKEEAETKYPEGSLFWSDEHFADKDAECYVFIVRLLDPRLSISKGFFRQMTKNAQTKRKLLEKLREKQALNDTSASLDISTSDQDDILVSLAYSNAAETISQLEDYVNMLTIVSTKGAKLREELSRSAEQDSWYENDSAFNVCDILDINPRNKSSEPWEERMNYDFLYSRNNTINYDDRRQFIKNCPQLWFSTQYYDLTNDGQSIVLDEELPKMSILVYRYPCKVVRLSMEHIDPYVFMSSYIPFKIHVLQNLGLLEAQTVKDVERTRYDPFPPLTEFGNQQLRLEMVRLREELERGNPFVQRQPGFSADMIRNAHFEIAEADKDTRVLLIPKHSMLTLEEARMRAFDDTVKAINTHEALPDPVKAVRDCLKSSDFEKNMKGTIFPPLYGENSDYKFTRYRRLTALGSYYVNFNDIFLEGPAGAIRQTHAEIRLAEYLTSLGSVIQYGAQHTYMWYGPPGTGKTRIRKFILENAMSEFLFRREDSKSSQADNTSTVKAGIICITDDLPELNLFLNDKDEGAFKSERTDGITQRDVFAFGKGKIRKTVKSIHDMRFMRWYFANFINPWSKMSKATADRFDFRYVGKSHRRETVADMDALVGMASAAELNHQRTIMKRLLHSFQIFSILYWYFVRSGAISYLRQKNLIMATLLHKRVLALCKYMYGVVPELIDGDRFEKDRLMPIVEAVTLHSVFISVCSGALKSLVKPGEPFSYEIFRKLANAGCFISNEEHYLAALSFHEDSIQNPELEAILMYFWKGKCTSDVYQPVQLVGYNKTPFYVRTASEANVQHLSDIPDVNYLLVCPDLCFPVNMTEESELYLIAKTVQSQNPRLSTERIKYTLKQLMVQRYSITEKRIVNNHKHPGEAQNYNSHEHSMENNARNFGPRYRVETGARVDLPILQRFAGSHNNVYGRYVPKYVLLREYFDHMYKVPYGYFQKTTSDASPQHKASVLEKMIPYICFDGIREREIVLPGMTFERTTNVECAQPLRPHIPKDPPKKSNPQQETDDHYRQYNNRNSDAMDVVELLDDPGETIDYAVFGMGSKKNTQSSKLKTRTVGPLDRCIERQVQRQHVDQPEEINSLVDLTEEDQETPQKEEGLEMPHIMKTVTTCSPLNLPGIANIPDYSPYLYLDTPDKKKQQWTPPDCTILYYIGDVSERFYIDVLEENFMASCVYRNPHHHNTQKRMNQQRAFQLAITKENFSVKYSPAGIEHSFSVPQSQIVYPNHIIEKYLSSGKYSPETANDSFSASLPIFHEIVTQNELPSYEDSVQYENMTRFVPSSIEPSLALNDEDI